MYSLIVRSLDRFVEDGFVYRVHFSVTLSKEGVKVSCNKSVDLERPEDLIPYEDLTEETVKTWIESKIGQEGMTSIKETLDSRLEKLTLAPTEQGLPWS